MPVRRLGDVRPLLGLLLMLAFAGATRAATAPFAALTVTPDGPQSYNITTGVTTLPRGGTVVDQGTGVTLHAGSLRYKEGESIDAKGADVTGSFGDLKAASLHIDIPAGVLEATGQVELTRGSLTLAASKVRYDAKREVVVFTGPVTGTSPDFEADRVLLDASTGDVLLLGHYRYSSSLVTLASPKAGGRLELHLHTVDGKPVYDASTEVSPALLARFSAELK